jgi:transposase
MEARRRFFVAREGPSAAALRFDRFDDVIAFALPNATQAPRHCSWLNQVEIWFSILTRRLLERSSFSSLDDLRQRLVAFIRYFNNVLAKPFKWTYTGRPLQA